MALIKPVPTRFGIPAEYWRIISISTDEKAQVVNWTLSGYFTEKARRAGGDPVGRTLSYSCPLPLYLKALQAPARKTTFNAYDAGRAFLYKATKEIVAGEAAAAKKNGGEMPLLFEAKDG